MQGIKIVEYDHSYAESVADMWSKSNEGWNGENMSQTAESVIRGHDNACHLCVYLAVKGNEVIGYCSLDQFKQDDGALYIDLLNVRPDYHGQKIGKMLVLQAVQKTIELGWPRVDLFTWPGNLKAVPLYKKCGFFWEKRDGSTHLMNFIPTVLQTEALQAYFGEMDWYENSARIIEVKPDGKKENKFSYLEYIWEKDGRQLRVEFEQTGRGIRLIDTEDYRISASVESHELVFGREYSIAYDVENKSGKPLYIAIAGQNDKNIRFDWEASFTVTDRKVVEGKFYVDKVDEEQDSFKTHPAVCAQVMINDKKALFKTGINPVYPARLTLHLPGKECYPGKPAECYLELKNMFSKPAFFEFTLEDREEISFAKKTYRIKLSAGETGTITIPYLLHRPLYYCANLTVCAMLEDGEKVFFTKKLSKPFRSRHGALHGENDIYLAILNGPYQAILYKHSNSLQVGSISEAAITWDFPKIGKPYTAELAKSKPAEIKVFYDGPSIGFRALYNLQDMKGIQLVMVCLLQPEGKFSRHFEVKNVSPKESGTHVWLSDNFSFDFSNGAFPYDGKIIVMENMVSGKAGRWNSEKTHENWLFAAGNKLTRGLNWDENEKIQFNTPWNQYFEHDLGKLSPSAAAATKPVELVMGAFPRWQDYRQYALKKAVFEKTAFTYPLQLSVNEGNPFVRENYTVHAKYHSEEKRKISFCLTSEHNLFNPLESVNEKEARFHAASQTDPGWDRLCLTADTGFYRQKQKSVVFCTETGTVDIHETAEAGKSVFYAHNNTIKMMAAPELSLSLLSLQHKGQEWLDSSFPHISTKAWWNPWVGGITPAISGISYASLLEEPRRAKKALLRDSKGNKWGGIQITVNIEKNEQLKGLQINQYFLLLPSAPVVCCLTGIRQQTGRYLDALNVGYECFLKPGDILPNCQVSFENMDGREVILKAGDNQYFMQSRNPLLYESESRQEKLLVFADPEEAAMAAGVSSQLIMSEADSVKQVKHGENIFFTPVFFIFAPVYFTSRQLKDLANIRFDVGEMQNENH